MEGETNHYSKMNRSNKSQLPLLNPNSFPLPTLESTLFQDPYKQIKEIAQNNFTVQNIGNSVSNFHPVTLSLSNQKDSEQIYRYDNEYSNYDKTAHNGFLELRLNEKVFEYLFYFFNIINK